MVWKKAPMWTRNKVEDEAFMLPGEKDDVFREAAKKMRHASNVSKSRKLRKLYVAEITYEGKRHEIWFNRLQIRCRRTDEALAGYIKAKCLGLK